MKRDNVKEYLLTYNAPRRIVQFLSFILFCAAIFGLGASSLLFPVLWTWGLQPNTIGDAFTAMQFLFYDGVFPWLAFASFLIVGILIGKSMCGWVCPFGFVQELLGFIKRKQTELSVRTHESMVYLKYFILGLTLFISATFSITRVMGVEAGYAKALGTFAKAPFTALSPSETLLATLPKMVLNFRINIANTPFFDLLSGVVNIPYLFWAQLAIMIGVLVFASFISRGWCKYLCPHGAIMAILNRFSFIGLRRDPVKCAKGGCRQCVTACPMRVPILDLPWEKFSDPECIYCMKCADACKDKAIKLKYP
ncbi:4Fe-4S binding protein [Candidatus Bathyarchaeota archaeon]|nr:4Fe-4S binding protein [Candidatus Bathyarchaeota archaeon]